MLLNAELSLQRTNFFFFFGESKWSEPQVRSRSLVPIPGLAFTLLGTCLNFSTFKKRQSFLKRKMSANIAYCSLLFTHRIFFFFLLVILISTTSEVHGGYTTCTRPYICKQISSRARFQAEFNGSLALRSLYVKWGENDS